MNTEPLPTEPITPSTPQGEPAPLVSPVVPTSSRPLPLVPILAILLVLAISATLFYYSRASTPQQAATATTSPTPTPMASVDPTKNWQSYTNNKMQLFLKYPADHNLQVILSEYNDLVFSLNTEKYASTFLDLAMLQTTIDDWYPRAYAEAQQQEQSRPALQQGPTIGGYPSHFSDFVQQGSGYVRNIFVQVGNELYQIVIPPTNNELQYQILSTLEFTN